MPNTSALSKLFSDHWDAWMRWDPTFATMCGDHRFDDRLPGADESHYTDWLTQLEGFRARLNEIDRTGLEADDRLNYDTFARMLTSEMDGLRYHAYRLPLSKTGGFHIQFPDLQILMPFEQVKDYENYLARLYAVRRYFDESIELMRLGLKTGFIPPRVTLDGVDKSILQALQTVPGLRQRRGPGEADRCRA